MATPVTDAFVKQIRGAATVMSGTQIHAVTDAAQAVKPVMEAAVVSMVGGDMRMRNVKPSGAIRVKYDARQDANAAASAEFTATGPIALIEQGAGSHDIAPRRSRRGRRRAALYGSGYAHPYAGRVRHPGTRGKGRWAAARDGRARPVARTAYVGTNVTAFRKAFQ